MNRQPSSHRALWTEADDAFLRERYPTCKAEWIARRLHRSVMAVRARARALDVKKTEEALRRLCGFKRGHRTWIKGLKGVCPGGAKVRQHWFRKGERSPAAQAKLLPIGSVRKCPVNKVWMRKVAEVIGDKHASWKRVHVLLWVEHNGPVPKGWIVVFKNRDSDDIRIDNLECVSRADHMRRHTCQKRSPEERSRIRQVARANQESNKRARAVRCVQLVGALA